MHATLPLLQESEFPRIRRGQLETLQVNMGYRCNQACLHCHVNAGPSRTETMSHAVAEQIVAYLSAGSVQTLDITGGAPELHQEFRYLVDSAVALGLKVIDRCNLTILEEPGQEDLAEYLAERRVHIIASMPCYLEDNVNAQRGDGVFASSIRALTQLNEKGYGVEESGLMLDLVYNPQGATLPPPQAALEIDYKKHFAENYKLVFNNLFALTNLPIQRFGSTLISRGQFHDYITLLKDSYRAENLASVMCRSLLSVDYQGYVYDCDFNQMLELPLGETKRRHLSEIMQTDLTGTAISVADHCYGCTAGQGSSCGGALA